MNAENFELAMGRALYTLRTVKERLAAGVEKTEFEREFQGQYVSPGVSVQSFIRQLRASGSLDESGSQIRFRESIAPALK